MKKHISLFLLFVLLLSLFAGCRRNPSAQECTHSMRRTAPGFQPGCGYGGITDAVYCGLCGLELQAPQRLDATGHSMVRGQQYEATCSQPGFIGADFCKYCGLKNGEDLYLPRLEHIFADRICTVCGDVDYSKGLSTGAISWDAEEPVFWVSKGTCRERDVYIPGNMDGLPIQSVRDFGNSDFIRSVTIGSGVVTIEYGAFFACLQLEKVVLPHTIRNIEAKAFLSCSMLQSILLPEGLEQIGGSAFSGCGSLKEITLPSTVTLLNHSAFSGCVALQTVNFAEGIEIAEIPMRCFSETALTEFSVPAGVILIADGAFWKCTQLRTLYLPASVERIGGRVFTFDISAGAEEPVPKDLSLDTVSFVIYYDGTAEQFYGIQKADDWSHGAGTMAVVCQDEILWYSGSQFLYAEPLK